MKTIKWILAATMAAGMAQAAIETNFFANFEGSSDGAATKANLDAGTPSGFWQVDNMEESFTTNNAAGGVAAFEVGKYTNAVTMAIAPDLADGVTFSFDVRQKAASGTTARQNAIVLYNTDGAAILTLHYDPNTFALGTNPVVKAFYNGAWQSVYTSTLLGSDDLADGLMDHIKVSMTDSNFTLHVNDIEVVGNQSFNNTANSIGKSLGSIRFFGVHSPSSLWYDNILVTSTKVKETYLYADFNNSENGIAGSATAVNMDAGTAVGSWDVLALEESYATNGMVAWDQGQYTNVATLATAANLSDNPVFSYDVRSKRAAAALGGKASALRVQNENGATIINMSYSCTSSNGQLKVWDAAASAWTNLTDALLGNSITPPSAMEHIDVEMGADGFTIYTNGAAVSPLMTYNTTTGSQVASIKFYGIHADASGAWYDNIKVQGPLASNVPPTGYAAWAAGWGVDIGATTNDYDGDGLLNIYEYGLGGDPTNSASQGTPPTFGAVNVGGTNYFGYVYPQLAADQNSGLDYYLELNTDLVLGTWTNSGYLVYGTNITGEVLDFVTNITTTVEGKKFIRLKIENL